MGQNLDRSMRPPDPIRTSSESVGSEVIKSQTLGDGMVSNQRKTFQRKVFRE